MSEHASAPERLTDRTQSTNVEAGLHPHGRLAGKNAIITGAAGYVFAATLVKKTSLHP